MKSIAFLVFTVVLSTGVVPAESPPKLAIVPGGEPKPVELLALVEAKLFESDGLDMVERDEIDQVLAEQKLAGLFDVNSALQLGKILRVDLFAVLEPTSIVVFDATTGLRYADETLPENFEKAVKIVVENVEKSVEKRAKLKDRKLETYGILEIRNADFPMERDVWCKAVAGMLERQLLRNGAAVLERSRLGQVNRERQLTSDGSNDLLTSMKLIDLEFTRGEQPKSFKITARIGEEIYRDEGMLDKPLDAVRELAGRLIGRPTTQENDDPVKEAARFQAESRFLRETGRYGAALEKAEAAIALDPENEGIQADFAHALIRHATELLDFRRYAPAPAQNVQEALVCAVRLQDYVEAFPKNNYSHGYQFGGRGNDAGRGARNSTYPMTGLRESLWRYVTKYYPKLELKSDVERHNRRVLEHWMEYRYRPIAAQAKHGKNRHLNAFSDIIQEGCFDLFTPCQNDADLARCYEELLLDWIQASKSTLKLTGSVDA